MNPDHLCIALDGRLHAVLRGTTLETLVTESGHTSHAVSTAVNGNFVPRAQRSTHVLVTGDAILLFQPIVGG
jgi:sulfur carrier protein